MRKKITVSACVLVLVALAVGSLLYMRALEQKRQNISSDSAYDMGDGYRTVVWKGSTYKYNPLITTILYAGLDSEGEMVKSTRFMSAPNADVIDLIILDKQSKKISVLAIDRDAIVEMKRYTVFGQDSGTMVTHLGAAYSAGDGGITSCENLRTTVSNLMGIPIGDYMITNRSSLPQINSIVGGVTVTVPNDDLATSFPEDMAAFVKGASIHLGDDMVERYVRYRDTEKDFSNKGRMERQESYIQAFLGKLWPMLEGERETVWDGINGLGAYAQTSVTRNKYLQYADLLSEMNEGVVYYQVPGESMLGEEHDEFHVDEDGLKELVLSIFYTKVS